jgi:hypothetical protein
METDDSTLTSLLKPSAHLMVTMPTCLIVASQTGGLLCTVVMTASSKTHNWNTEMFGAFTLKSSALPRPLDKDSKHSSASTCSMPSTHLISTIVGRLTRAWSAVCSRAEALASLARKSTTWCTSLTQTKTERSITLR